MTLQDQYDSVCAAIAAVEGGAQSYRLGSREVNKANIMHLYAERRKLAAALSDQNGYTVQYAEFDRR